MQIDPRFHDAFVTSKLQALRREAEMDHLTREERADRPGLVERMLQRVSKRLGLPARQAVSQPMRSPERIGGHVGQDRLDRFLDSGGVAEGYLGVQVPLGGQAAIRRLQAQLVPAGDIARFRAEAQASSTLQQPDSVRMLDGGGEVISEARR